MRVQESSGPAAKVSVPLPAASWAPHPRASAQSEAGWVGSVRQGRLGLGWGLQSGEQGGRRSPQLLFPSSAQVPGELAHASYFLPVRWICWKRVMEKAMPRI